MLLEEEKYHKKPKKIKLVLEKMSMIIQAKQVQEQKKLVVLVYIVMIKMEKQFSCLAKHMMII